MTGLIILQSRALDAAFAVAAGLMCLVVVWKSIDYIVTTRRNIREREHSGTDRDA